MSAHRNASTSTSSAYHEVNGNEAIASRDDLLTVLDGVDVPVVVVQHDFKVAYFNLAASDVLRHRTSVVCPARSRCSLTVHF
jgi:hypothetical protein